MLSSGSGKKVKLEEQRQREIALQTGETGEGKGSGG